jgi:hypothetical protein
VLQFRSCATVADRTDAARSSSSARGRAAAATTVTRRLALSRRSRRSSTTRPSETLLGTVAAIPASRRPSGRADWADPVTENPPSGRDRDVGALQRDRRRPPIHIHEVVFEVVNRQDIVVDEDAGRCVSRPPLPADAVGDGFKDTVIAYPGQVTRSGRSSPSPGSSCGTATSSSTKTTR